MRALATLVTALVAATLTVPGPTPLPAAAAQHTEPVARAAKGPRLVVDARKGKHRISPLIYGVNFAERGFAKDVDLPVDRWGGNAVETYNWQVRGSNHGQDWYFTNFADCWTDAFDFCQRGQDYSAADAQVQQDRATGTDDAVDAAAAGLGREGGVVHGRPPRAATPRRRTRRTTTTPTTRAAATAAATASG